jgi:hypothetical protein
MIIETFELPSFWASALINGDTSGLSDVDEKSLDAFTDFMVKNYGSCWAINCTDDPHFTSYHDATRFGVLACDVLEFSFDVSKGK